MVSLSNQLPSDVISLSNQLPSDVISLSSGVKKFMEHESECVEHALNSLHNQLTLSLEIGITSFIHNLVR